MSRHTHRQTRRFVADGRVDFIDIQGMVEGFRHLPTAPAVQRCDVYPALPDYTIDFVDIATVVEAFRGAAYTFEPPEPCY